MAGGFDEAAVAPVGAAARRETAIDSRRFIAPDDDLAAIAYALSREDAAIHVEAGGGSDVGGACVGHFRIFAPIVAADEDCAAILCAGCADSCAIHVADFVAEDLDGSPSPPAPTRKGRGGCAVGADYTSDFHPLAGFEHDLAAFHHRAIGADGAAVFYDDAE